MDNFIYPNASKIAGVDEVGRGALVGAVVAAAVILDPDNPIVGLADSKMLTEKKRLELNYQIKNKAIAWSIARAESTEIDEMNISYATMLAIKRAVLNLKTVPDFVLIDGNYNLTLPIPYQSVIKGDILVKEISAASIIAKVSRDFDMYELDKKFPQYGFAKHKGYPTNLHKNKLLQYGAISHHRCSFKPVRNVIIKTKNYSTTII
ncbi:ribonuclease HII [Pantoea sp. Aalb]|uniref:ribonuclease HII n=1 Tax=Pantoea sp. Aalb TaxID=2576762 RepID=UPI0013274CE1|nr:ribonuclease HII [Pantoea sp. Aalb]MXP67229.1 ribonuclease HII [Pantoea sp. Aalb]